MHNEAIYSNSLLLIKITKIPRSLAPWSIELSHPAYSLTWNNEKKFAKNSRQHDLHIFGLQCALFFLLRTSSYAENNVPRWQMLMEHTYASECLLLLNNLDSYSIRPWAQKTDFCPRRIEVSNFLQEFVGIHNCFPVGVQPIMRRWHLYALLSNVTTTRGEYSHPLCSWLVFLEA